MTLYSVPHLFSVCSHLPHTNTKLKKTLTSVFPCASVDTARKSLIQILEGTATRHGPGLSLRVGVVGYRDFTRDYISFVRERIDDGDGANIEQLKLGVSPMFKLEGGPDATHMSGELTSQILVLHFNLAVTEWLKQDIYPVSSLEGVPYTAQISSGLSISNFCASYYFGSH